MFFIRLKDSTLEELLKKNSCKIFEKNVSLPISPSITYRFDSLLTLFRCNKSQKSTYEGVFNSKGYQSSNVCDSFILYYNTSVNYVYDPRVPLPIGCSLIQLPVPQSSEAKSNSSGLFHLLTDEVVLGWTVSDECNQCYNAGGRCQKDNTTNKFHCHHNFVQVAGNRKTKVIVTVAVFLSCCTGILILVFSSRKRTFWYKCLMFWESKAEDYRNIEAFLKNNGSYAPKRYNYSEVKEMTTRFKNKLGQGGYGNVYKGSLQNGKQVPVKVLHDIKGSGEEFINEVASISRTSHVNIVSLVGFCFEGRKRDLIYEFMPNGSLEKFIYEERSDSVRQLDWPILYQIALGIARGLEYLHRGCNTRILHFDIKPHNILLD